MNRLYSLIGILILALGLAGLMVKFTFSFGVDEKREIKKISGIRYSLLRLPSKDLDNGKIEIIPIQSSLPKSGKDPILAEFGRLGSFIYLPRESKDPPIEEKGNTGIILGDTPGIVSLYDLFSQYTLFDRAGDFRIDQITNGSFYISRESDGKISVYAIDGVARLAFLYEGQDMTSMILFPGSYIRFDPKNNRSLRNADLFRTILSLQIENNEIFEFVNPRVNRGGDDEDIFLNYRLNPNSKLVFRALSLLFKKKVSNIDLRRNYSTCMNFDQEEKSILFLNPTKRDYELLIYLSDLLSCALEPRASKDLVKRIGKVYNETKHLKLAQSTAQSVVEKFLLDGRFALYGGIVNSQYQDIYDSIAEIIGIKPTTRKSRLFQTLSDIYSRNLFTQKKSSNRIKIDTYSPTAIELEKTLSRSDENSPECKENPDSCTIDKKDYFDIAIYAFNILRKMEDGGQVFSKSTLEDSATYRYLSIFLQSASLYIESIEDPVKKSQTIMSFSRQFYDHIITTLTTSLYLYYTQVNDGALYVHKDYQDGLKLKFTDEFIDNIDILTNRIDALSLILTSTKNSTGGLYDDSYSRIEQNIARIKAFSSLIRSDEYKEYVQSPYKVNKNSESPMPLVDENNTIIRYSREDIQKIQNTKAVLTDPRIKELRKIWPTTPDSSWIIEGDFIRINKAEYTLSRGGTTTTLLVSALYKNGLITDTIILYKDLMIEVVTPDGIGVNTYYTLMANMKYYLDTIDETLQGESTSRTIRIFPDKKRININESIYLVPIR